MISCAASLIVSTSKAQKGALYTICLLRNRRADALSRSSLKGEPYAQTPRQKLDMAENTSNGDQSSLTSRHL